MNEKRIKCGLQHVRDLSNAYLRKQLEKFGPILGIPSNINLRNTIVKIANVKMSMSADPSCKPIIFCLIYHGTTFSSGIFDMDSKKFMMYNNASSKAWNTDEKPIIENIVFDNNDEVAEMLMPLIQKAITKVTK